MKFTEFNLNEKVLEGIRNAGFTETMPVQEKTIQSVLEGRDVEVQSQTGSGKTAAFLIPLLNYYATTEESQRKKTLIIAPTRELAVQIEEEINLLGVAVNVKSGSFYGGVGYKQQEAALASGAEIIIGTPGRLIDFGKSGKINFREFGNVIIDEADRLFDMGFYPDIRKMMKMLVPKEERRTMLFSATLSIRVRNIAWEYMNQPVEIEIAPENVTVEEISQVLYHVSSDEKLSLLLGVLKEIDPGSAILFTNTKYAAVELAERLKVNGYKVHYLMGDLPQRKRLSIIDKLKSGEVKFLVATDVAARGLHVDDLELVVNYDIPEDYENYVHRIGRTARAGKSGKAVTFACEKYVYGLEAIEKYINMKIPVQWPEKELFAEDMSAGMSFQKEKREAVNPSGRKPYDNRGRTSGGQYRKSTGGRSSSGNRYSKNERSVNRDQPEKRNPVSAASSGKPKTDRQKKQSPERKGNRKPDYTSRDRNIPSKLTRTSTPEERLAYYRSKYGEDFELKTEPVSAVKKEKPLKKQKKGILGKIFGSRKKTE